MSPEGLDLHVVRRMALQKLESLERAGVTHLPKPRDVSPFPAAGLSSSPGATLAAPAAPPALASLPQAAVMEASTSGPDADLAQSILPAPQTTLEPQLMKPTAAKSRQGADAPAARDNVVSAVPAEKRPAALQVVQREVAQCLSCRELASSRTQTVFGVGNPNARLCFLGEAPGADEDAQGEPFVGRAGQLLNKIIEACTMRREDVYILNTLKCRPPGNRNPAPDELASCRGFLDRQLEILRPEFICCLGAVAAQALLATEAPIGKLRKQFFDHRGMRVICTYHPAYLLRNPAAKKDVWEDMQLLLREMGIKLPTKK